MWKRDLGPKTEKWRARNAQIWSKIDLSEIVRKEAWQVGDIVRSEKQQFSAQSEAWEAPKWRFSETQKIIIFCWFFVWTGAPECMKSCLDEMATLGGFRIWNYKLHSRPVELSCNFVPTERPFFLQHFWPLGRLRHFRANCSLKNCMLFSIQIVLSRRSQAQQFWAYSDTETARTRQFCDTLSIIIFYAFTHFGTFFN